MNAMLYNLARLVGDRYQLDLIVGTQEVPERLRDFYDLHRGREVGWPDPAGFFSARRICASYVRSKNPDLLMNACKPQTLGLVVAQLGEKYDIPSLVRMTGETFRQRALKSGLWGKAKMWLLHEKMAGRAYSVADRILAVGRNLRESLVSRGYEKDKVSDLPQPFDPEPFEPESSEKDLGSRLGLEPERKTVLFVGRLSWYKGGDRLLKIARRVSEKSQDYQFCLVGDGEYRDKFESFAEHLVHLAGEVPHEMIPAYYGAADLLVFPSRTEGLPNVILEGLAAELPIAASPVGEIPEYVSSTFDSVDEYVEYILAGDWNVDELPGELCWENQRQSYLELFDDILK